MIHSIKKSPLRYKFIFSLIMFLFFSTNSFSQTISIKGSHTLAICSDSTVWAWGGNYAGYLGDSTLITSYVPVQTRDTNGIGQLRFISSVGSASGTSIAIRSDSTLWTWGLNNYGQLGIGNMVNKRTPVKVHGYNNIGYFDSAVAVCGNYNSLFALKSNGTVWGWGWNGTGVLGDGTYSNSRTSPVQVIEAMDGHLDSIVQISSGPEHALALQSNGSVWAWGWDYYGELGSGTGATSLSAIQVQNPNNTGIFYNASQIAAGDHFSVILKTDGTVWTFGKNEFGQLGDNTFANSLLPIQVKDSTGLNFLTGIMRVAGGGDHVLALDSTGKIYAWGNNEKGQLGNSFLGIKSQKPVRIHSLTNVSEILAGNDESGVLLEDGTFLMWGNNWIGNLGNNSTSNYTILPHHVLNSNGLGKLQNVKQISCGYDHEIALMHNGTVFSWGDNSTNDLPPATIELSPLPVQVRDSTGTQYLSNIKQIAAGENHNVALTNSGHVYGWGHNTYSVLGNILGSYTVKPIAYRNFSGVLINNAREVAAAYSHTAILRNDSTVIYYGNFNGLTSYYGNSFQDSSGTLPLMHIKSIAAGSQLMLALDADSMVWTWGLNNYNQLGEGTANDQYSPVRLLNETGSAPLSGVKAISSKVYHSLALMADSTVYAWGYNGNGQLGTGDILQNVYPRQVLDSTGLQPLRNIIAIAAGRSHSLALSVDSTVWVWGNNTTGAFGNNTVTSSLLPVHVKNIQGNGLLKDVIGISGGEFFTGFLVKDSSALTTGYNDHGQTGAFVTIGINTPTQPHLACMAAIPNPGFSANDTSGCGSICIQFSDTSTHFADTFEWTFAGGNPSSSTQKNPLVCYAAPGNYPVKLKVSNFLGTDSVLISNYINVYNLPIANAGNDTSVCQGSIFQISGNGGIAYQWTPGAGIICSTCAQTNATLNTTSDLTLQVTDANGCTDTDVIHIDVNPLPQSSFTHTVNGNSLSVTSTSSNELTLLWIFGDGETGTGSSENHEYITDGTYQLCLVASNDCGTDTQCVSITVINNSIDKNFMNEIRFSPNPTRGDFSVLNLKEEALFYIYDLLGNKIVAQQVVPEQKISIELPTGVYFTAIHSTHHPIQYGKLILIE